MTTSDPQKSTKSLPITIAFLAGSSVIAATAITAAIIQQHALGPTSITSASGDAAASTVTNPQIAPSTPLITFATPTLKAPPYGKS